MTIPDGFAETGSTNNLLIRKPPIKSQCVFAGGATVLKPIEFIIPQGATIMRVMGSLSAYFVVNFDNDFLLPTTPYPSPYIVTDNSANVGRHIVLPNNLLWDVSELSQNGDRSVWVIATSDQWISVTFWNDPLPC